MADLAPMLADLKAESEDLDILVSGLSDEGWAAQTPAAGWTIAHQVAHLAWTDDAALLAMNDPSGFQSELHKALAAIHTFTDDAASERAQQPAAELLEGWRAGRAALAEALLGVPAGQRIAWFGPPMGAASMATARLMETWAHGQDVADALGIARLPTPRLRNVAHLGVRTRDFAFLLHDRTPPSEPFRVELSAPDGSVWSWGPGDEVPGGGTQSVTGPALDFCLLVTQRRHRTDLALVADGADADAWLDIAQAFAGPPGLGRPETSKPA